MPCHHPPAGTAHIMAHHQVMSVLECFSPGWTNNENKLVKVTANHPNEPFKMDQSVQPQFPIRIYHLNYQALHLGHLSILFHAQHLCQEAGDTAKCYCYMLHTTTDFTMTSQLRLNCELSFLGLDRIKPIWVEKICDQRCSNVDSLAPLMKQLDAKYEIKRIINNPFEHQSTILHKGMSILGLNPKTFPPLPSLSRSASISERLPYLQCPYVLSLRARGITKDQLKCFVGWNHEIKSLNSLVPQRKTLTTIPGVINPILIKIVNWSPNKVIFSDYYQPMTDSFYINKEHLDKIKYDTRIYLKGFKSHYFTLFDKNPDAPHLKAKIVPIEQTLVVKKTLSWVSFPSYDATFVYPTASSRELKIKHGKMSSIELLQCKVPDLGICTHLPSSSMVYLVSPMFSSSSTSMK